MKRRVGEHARPYRDYQGLSHGRTLMETRARIAAGLYGNPEYRDWTRNKLREDGQRALQRLEERVRMFAPDQSAESLRQIARWTSAGQQILARAERPTEADLQRYLSAWLGDIPAHDLFVRWESLRLDRLLRTGGTDLASDRFRDEWHELRLIFHVPSYARVLTLMAPVYDGSSDRIGFWRVVLPRLAWFMPRARGYKRHPEWTDLPLDLIPDFPFGYWIVTRLLEDDAVLFGHLRDRGYQVERVSYRLRGKANRWSPQRAFRDAEVTVVLAAGRQQGDAAPARFTLVAGVGIDRMLRAPRMKELELAVDGDQFLADLIAAH